MRAALADHYAGSAVVAMGEPPADGEMLLRGSDAGSDRLELFVFANADASQARLVARLDNLGKGASGACVQTLNIMAGLPDTPGPRLLPLPPTTRGGRRLAQRPSLHHPHPACKIVVSGKSASGRLELGSH